MTQIQIKLFATLKEKAGAASISVSTVQPATVDDLVTAIAAAYPALAPALPVSIVAVNRAFADPDTPVMPDDEVAIFPPVSGG